MIRECLKLICCEDLSLIENYKEAINSEEKYHLHHRLGEKYSVKELKKMNMYYHRPACELIFLRHDEHLRLHSNGNTYGKGKKAWNKGLKTPEETRKKQSEKKLELYKNKENHPRYGKPAPEHQIEVHRQRLLGKPAMIRGTKALYKDGKKKMIKPEYLDKYISEGWKYWKDYVTTFKPL